MHPRKENIIDFLTQHARRSPQTAAFCILHNAGEPEQEITYPELASRVEALAHRLIEMQLEGEKVLLVYQDIMKFIVAFLACQFAGIVAVPAPYAKGRKQVARLCAIMRDAGALTVFCSGDSLVSLQKGLDSILLEGETQVINTDVQDLPGGYLPVLKPVFHPVAFIQYTSGSTGNPKGVVISQKNLLHNQQLIKDTFRCDESSVIFSWLPFHHDMGLIGNILHSIYIGCKCILLSPVHFMQSPGRWLESITKYKVTHSGGPNFAYDLCIDKIAPDELSRLDLSSWKVAYNGSEPIRHETIQAFGRTFQSARFDPNAFYPCYGLAEATLLVSGNKKDPVPATVVIDRETTGNGEISLTDKSNPQAQVIVSSGEVASGMDIKIISVNDQRDCAELEEGEICISGDSVTNGYWNKDNGPFFYEMDGKTYLRTGDLGFFYEGDLFVHGRLKDMLIVRGRNLYPRDIEEMIFTCDSSIEKNGVAVFSSGNMGDEMVIVAEIKRAFIKSLNSASVIRSIDKDVNGSFGINPLDIILTAPLGIPRTTSGKIQRAVCRDLYNSNSFAIIGAKSQLPGNTENRDTKDIQLAEVLGSGNRPDIQKYIMALIGSKFEHIQPEQLTEATELTGMGIDSLRAMELINAINRDMSIHMDPVKVFHDNTLSGLITTIENMLWLKHQHVVGNEISI